MFVRDHDSRGINRAPLGCEHKLSTFAPVSVKVRLSLGP